MDTWEVHAIGNNGRYVIDYFYCSSEKAARREFFECHRHTDWDITCVRKVEKED